MNQLPKNREEKKEHWITRPLGGSAQSRKRIRKMARKFLVDLEVREREWDKEIGRLSGTCLANHRRLGSEGRPTV